MDSYDIKKDKTKKRKFSLKPGAIIALSFFVIICIGTILLLMPFSQNTQHDNEHVSFIDAFFTSVSALCVTGLSSVDIYDTFNIFGRIVVAVLIQLGGLGVTTFSVAILLIASKSLSIKQNALIKEAWNIDTFKGLRTIFYKVLIFSFSCEIVGAFLSVISFSQHMDIQSAFGRAFFHAVSAFNNAGFDVLGGFQGLVNYKDDVLLNLVTSLLIILGGLGFLVILEVIKKNYHVNKFSLQTKVVLTMTTILLLFGFFMIKISEGDNISWLGSWFFSVSSRTAGFSTYNLANFKHSTLIIIEILMFIGAGPGSTGGGIKVTTFFVLIMFIVSVVTNKKPSGFRRTISNTVIKKASVLFFLGMFLIVFGCLLISLIEGTKYIEQISLDGTSYFREYNSADYFFEATSAFGTVGLSTGITPYLNAWSKFILTILMFVGRVGPLSIATLNNSNNLSTARYVEENISIG